MVVNIDNLFAIDWAAVFVPTVPIIEIVVRGTLVYLLLFLFLRLLRREMGTLSPTDLLVVVIIADATQNAMSGGYTSVTEGLVLVATIGFWDYLLDWLSYRFPRIRRLIRPPSLLLIKNGHLLRRNMRREMVTEEELMSQLREQGVDDIAKVKESYLEGDGNISVITFASKDDKARGSKNKKKRVW